MAKGAKSGKKSKSSKNDKNGTRGRKKEKAVVAVPETGDPNGLYTDPALREKLRQTLLAKGKGGPKGEWTAGKARLLVERYEARGGGYTGARPPAAAPPPEPEPAATPAPGARNAGRPDAVPWEGYEDMTVVAVRERLAGLDAAALRQVHDFESTHKSRATLLSALSRRLGPQG